MFDVNQTYTHIAHQDCTSMTKKCVTKNVLNTLCIYPKSDKYFIPEATPRAIPRSWCIESLEWCSWKWKICFYQTAGWGNMSEMSKMAKKKWKSV